MKCALFTSAPVPFPAANAGAYFTSQVTGLNGDMT